MAKTGTHARIHTHTHTNTYTKSFPLLSRSLLHVATGIRAFLLNVKLHRGVLMPAATLMKWIYNPDRGADTVHVTLK